MKKFIHGICAAAVLVTTPALADKVTVEISNLTNAIYFTPLLVAAHNGHTHLFELGTPASPSLQAMAEGGEIAGLESELQALGANVVSNPAGGVLAPGATTEASLRVNRSNRYLSVVAMLLPTNDGFMGLDSIPIPRWPGVYTYYVQGYDAGTEANDEVINGGGAPGTPGIPADPGGNGGSGASGVITTEHNPTVHVHRGILGDTDPNGGISDLDSRVHSWLNPVAKVVVKVEWSRRY